MFADRNLMRFLGGAFLAALLAGCSLIDIRPFAITTNPAGTGSVMKSAPNVWVQFPQPVVESVVAPLLSVTTGGQSVTGDLSWSGNRLIFTPVSTFRPGVPYVLELVGTVQTSDGRSFDENIVVPFYVGSDASQPIITAETPASGATIDGSTPLVLSFSEAMDTGSFLDAFSLSPPAPFTTSWSSGDATVTVTPQGPWTAQTVYTWTVSSDCKSKTGIAVAQQWSADFLVQSGTNVPSVVSAQPATLSGGTVASSPGPLDGNITYLQSILLTFSEAVDLASLESAFSLSPSVSGAFQQVSPTEELFTPSSGWQMNQQYLLSISTGLDDLSGNHLAETYDNVFTPSIPKQSVSSIELQSATLTGNQTYTAAGGQLDNTSPDALQWTPTTYDANLGISAIITFSQPYDDAHKTAITNAVTLDEVFPAQSNPIVAQVSWTSDTQLTVFFSGLTNSSTSSTPFYAVYYELTIGGGASESINQDGSYLPKSVTLLLQSGPAS